MALSPAEKQRRYRERKKQAEKKAPDAAIAVFKTPFSTWRNHGEWTAVEFALAVCGFEIEPFDDETSGKEMAARLDASGAKDGLYDQYEGAVGRAELMIGQLIDAAMSLAKMVNQYKREEISNRINEIENTDLSKPEVRKQALSDIVELKKMLDQLEKQIRITFPQWKVIIDKAIQ